MNAFLIDSKQIKDIVTCSYNENFFQPLPQNP